MENISTLLLTYLFYKKYSYLLTITDKKLKMNTVQFGGGDLVNTIVTSREAILEVSRNLLREKGWNAINIRTVATVSGISVGSIYNYFTSKSDLVSATIESVWGDIFRVPKQKEIFDNLVSCIEWIFESIEKGDEKYPNFFTLHSTSFLGTEKTDGKNLMEQSLKHMQRGLYEVLKSDKNVRPDAFNDMFTPNKFVKLIFSYVIAALFQQDYDCTTIIEVVRRSVY